MGILPIPDLRCDSCQFQILDFSFQTPLHRSWEFHCSLGTIPPGPSVRLCHMLSVSGREIFISNKSRQTQLNFNTSDEKMESLILFIHRGGQ